ncbi:MAG: hypothetical protein DRI36_06500 [Caldiserica bacterium]|nr:MAG: hypothetical protein DRI36_06500 [Caldisericota bacterium]
MKLEESFFPVIAGDENSSYPHHIPEGKKIEKYLLIDFGVKYNYYHSDLTRFFIIDKMKTDKLIKKAFNDLNKAKEIALHLIKPGKVIGKVVKEVENYLKDRGWKDNLYHTLGHGIGIEVHEYPSLSNKNRDIFKENMVFTIEPGIYIRGIGGVRIEDVYLLKKGGVEKL